MYKCANLEWYLQINKNIVSFDISRTGNNIQKDWKLFLKRPFPSWYDSDSIYWNSNNFRNNHKFKSIFWLWRWRLVPPTVSTLEDLGPALWTGFKDSLLVYSISQGLYLSSLDRGGGPPSAAWGCIRISSPVPRERFDALSLNELGVNELMM